MTTYFTAPDGIDEPTLWAETDDPRRPVAILRHRDLGPMAHHWDELVARVIAGNPDRTNELANKLYDLTRTPSPPSQGLMQLMPNPDGTWPRRPDTDLPVHWG